MPGSTSNSGPARENTIALAPWLSAPQATRARCHPHARSAGECLPHVGLHPRERDVERAPALRLARKSCLAVDQRRYAAIGQHRDEREQSQRDEDLNERETSGAHQRGTAT